MLKKVKMFLTQEVGIPAWLWLTASFFAGYGIGSWIEIIVKCVQLLKLKKNLD